MNDKLKKEIKKQSEYQKKYMKSHKMLCVNLDIYEDRDIIAWMSRQPNRSEAVRRILREAIG